MVDAIDDAAHAFYRRHDFIPVPEASRLYLKIATMAAALGRPSRTGRRPATSAAQA